MEPFTHAFTSIALSQTARNRLPRFGMLMMVAGGVAPDIDSIGYAVSPGAFFRMHRVVLHSILGAIILSCVLAYLFVELDKKMPWDNPQKKRPPVVTYWTALIFCGVGVAGHIVLDLISTVGVALFWPFYNRFYGTDLVLNLDFWMLAILVLGLLLPLLIRVVNEEIGAGAKKRRGVSIAAIVTFALLGAYVGGRAGLRSRAVHLLLYRDYHGREADSAHAYPTLTSPFVWRGVVTTDDTMEVITVPILKPDDFENDRSLSFFKPPDTPDLKAAEATPSVKRYMLYAREPFAVTDRREDDYRVEIKDLRFPPDDPSPENINVRVQFNSLLKERYEKYIYASVFTP
ncbi:MAG TPA: metal-dependent hydrolase [Candidatus Acidoferrales bacterium]|nr:metal-dependent hydrolase [Candidatus Acidoferrales bacterium]